MRRTAIIEFPVAEVKRLSGLDVPLAEMKRVLGHLGFFVAGAGETVKVAIPSWRPDIEGKADIVEEVVRIVGVDRVPSTPFERGDSAAQAGAHRRAGAHPQGASARSRRAGWSRPSPGRSSAKAQAELFGGGQAELALANPIAADLSDMRPSLIPGLVAAAQKNADRGFPDVGAVRGRADVQGRPARGSAHRRVRRAPRARARRAAPGGTGAATARSMRST